MPGLDFWRRHRQIVGLVLMALVVACGCVLLARWQYHRYQHKHEAKQLVQHNYAAPAVPLHDLLATVDAPLRATDAWRQVRLTGQYDVAGTTLVRNRPRDVDSTGPTYGYDVLVPLVLDDGTAFLVDRGWVPSGTSGRNPGQAPDAVPAPPSGTVTVVARLRPSEPAKAGRTPAGQVASIDVQQVARATGHELYRAYGQLAGEQPAASPAPALAGPPELDGGEGINFSYAVQWLLFAVLALGFPYWWLRRQRQTAEPPASADGAPAEGRDVDPREVPVPTRRRRLWDDEDE